MASLRRHNMGDDLQRLYLTPDGHSGATRNTCLPAEEGQDMREMGGDAAAGDGAGASQEGGEHDQLDPQCRKPNHAAWPLTARKILDHAGR
jgi:hypothetical protein